MFRYLLNIFTLLFLIVLAGSGIYAQTVSGYVKDENNKEPIPFADVLVKGTQQGIMTDVNGFFTIVAPKNDTLCISSVGYNPKEIQIRKDKENQLLILLKESIKTIGEVTIRSKTPRAKVIFNEIQKHKKENREQITNVNEYKTLASTTVYIAVDTLSRVIRSFENLDDVTVEFEGQNLRFSPVYLSEQAENRSRDSVQTLYSKKNGIFPKLNQAFESLILNNVVVDLDFYKDQINILDRGFISPLHNSAMLYYNLYLNDSTKVGETKFYIFSFTPKNKHNQLFSGHFMVEDGSFALTEIQVNIPKEANLNFVNGFEGNVIYKKLPEGGWFYNEQNTGINLAFSSQKDTVSKYSSNRVDNISNGNWLINKSTHYTTSKRLNGIKANTWKNQPEFASDQLTTDAYRRVDRLKQHEVVKGIDAIGGIALTGYMNAGKVDIGPLYDLYSSNTVEGKRFSIPLRTSEQMSKHFSVGGYLGMGTRNNELKYGMNMAYQPQETDKFVFRLKYSDDYSLVTQDNYLRLIKNNPNTRSTGNFIAWFTTREENPYLKGEQSFEFRMEYNTKNDLHFEMSPYYLRSTSTPEVKFIRNNTNYKHYENYGIFFNLRIPFRQHYDKYYFDRVYYSGRIPVVNLSCDIGQTLLPDESMKNSGMYVQLHGSIQGRIFMGQVFMNYIVNAGYLLGEAPYDLLDQPVGSMSLGYSKDRFNLLHHASFAHNLYSNTHLYFNGGGILLNRIPLVNKLKLREIVSIKCHFGKLGEAYKGVFDLPRYYKNDINSLYAEIGFGVTNIFKVLRIEYIYQLNPKYNNQDFTDNGGIRLRAEMSF